jgi:hypothetical protein
MPMARQRRRILPWVIVAALAGASCKKDEAVPADASTPGEPGRRPSPSRVEALALDALGVQPGMLADGAVYVALRADAAQSFLHQLPLPSRVARELAEARRELGFDPFTDDVLARFAIPPDAVVSMTLGRPVGVDARKAVAKDLRSRDARFLELVSRVQQEQDAIGWLDKPLEPPPPSIQAPPPPVPTATPIVFAPPPKIATPPPVAPHPTVVEEPIVPPEGEPYVEEPPPPPPPIDPADRREIEALVRHGHGIALQLRLHLPSDDPSKVFGELRTRIDADALDRGRAACRGLSVELCAGGGRELLVVRRDGKAAVFDLLLFSSRSDPTADAELRRPAVTEALAAPRAERPVLAGMAGHASAYLDARALAEAVEHMQVGQALRDLEWSSSYAAESVRQRFEAIDGLRRLLDAPRLYDGVLANAHHARDRTQLQIRWTLREGQAELARAVLAPPPLVVPVPSLAALCDGALVCARSRGVPSPQELGVKLGVGIYADVRALENVLYHSSNDEAGALLVLAATWPNVLGTLLWHVPLAEVGRGGGPEAALVRGLLDTVGRVQALGLSVRHLATYRYSLTGEYALYARVPANDLGLVSTLLAMAEQRRLEPTTLEGVEGSVAMLRLPEDVPAVLMTREDPETAQSAEGKPVRYGWLSVVDDPKRLQWLLGLPTDDGQAPLVYAEVPDLWRLVAAVPEAVDDLGFARTWATDRALVAALHLDDGQPLLLMEVALRQGAPAEPE